MEVYRPGCVLIFIAWLLLYDYNSGPEAEIVKVVNHWLLGPGGNPITCLETQNGQEN